MNSVQNPPYQAGMDARFRIAARHSRMVRVLRVAVPAAVTLAMTAIVFVSVYNPFRMLLPKLPVDIGNLVVSGTKITMESPHMSGYTPDQRPYEVCQYESVVGAVHVAAPIPCLPPISTWCRRAGSSSPRAIIPI